MTVERLEIQSRFLTFTLIWVPIRSPSPLWPSILGLSDPGLGKYACDAEATQPVAIDKRCHAQNPMLPDH